MPSVPMVLLRRMIVSPIDSYGGEIKEFAKAALHRIVSVKLPGHNPGVVTAKPCGTDRTLARFLTRGVPGTALARTPRERNQMRFLGCMAVAAGVLMFVLAMNMIG